MKLAQVDVEAEKPKPPCSVCGKPSRAREALYWGKNLCDPCELAWADAVDGMSRVPPEMGPAFDAWLSERKARRVAA